MPWKECSVMEERVWTPRKMQAFSLVRFRHVIRCCRVSGLTMRLSHAAGPYGAAQTGSKSLTRTFVVLRPIAGFPNPVSMIVCPYLSSDLLTSPTPPEWPPLYAVANGFR